MIEIRLPEELWVTRVLPEGIVERVLADDGARVEAGQAIAEVRVGDRLHEIAAPGAGVLVWAAGAGALVEPGSLLASLRP